MKSPRQKQIQNLWNFKVKIPEEKLKSRKKNPGNKKLKSQKKIKFQDLWNFKVKIPEEKLKSRKKK